MSKGSGGLTQGTRPIPFRTRKLSLVVPMVVGVTPSESRQLPRPLYMSAGVSHTEFSAENLRDPASARLPPALKKRPALFQPVLIPNTEVKLASGDGSLCYRRRE